MMLSHRNNFNDSICNLKLINTVCFVLLFFSFNCIARKPVENNDGAAFSRNDWLIIKLIRIFIMQVIPVPDPMEWSGQCL